MKQALEEVRNGLKGWHWIWYVFPPDERTGCQILGYSGHGTFDAEATYMALYMKCLMDIPGNKCGNVRR